MSFYSQFGEDKYVSALFPAGYVGSCVEVGAYDGVAGSNTYHFEQKGWKTLCIEPNPIAFEKCRRIRSHAVQCCIGATNSEDVPFYVYHLQGNNESAISSLEPDMRLVQSHKHLIESTNTIRVRVRTLTDVLQEAGFPTTIDFVSIDTENTELDVLRGLDLGTYNIRYFVIENNYNEPHCEAYLATFGYTKVNRTGVNDIYKKV